MNGGFWRIDARADGVPVSLPNTDQLRRTKQQPARKSTGSINETGRYERILYLIVAHEALLVCHPDPDSDTESENSGPRPVRWNGDQVGCIPMSGFCHSHILSLRTAIKWLTRECEVGLESRHWRWSAVIILIINAYSSFITHKIHEYTFTF